MGGWGGGAWGLGWGVGAVGLGLDMRLGSAGGLALGAGCEKGVVDVMAAVGCEAVVGVLGGVAIS